MTLLLDTKTNSTSNVRSNLRQSSGDVVGLDSLWDIFLHVKDDDISNQASETLLNVSKIDTFNNNNNEGIVNEKVIQFLNKIFLKHLAPENDDGNNSSNGSNGSNGERKGEKVTVRCLSLLLKFVQNSRLTIAVMKEKNNDREVQQSRSNKTWTFDQSTTSSSFSTSSATSALALTNGDQACSDEITIPSTHGKSCRGSDLTISVSGKYLSEESVHRVYGKHL